MHLPCRSELVSELERMKRSNAEYKQSVAKLEQEKLLLEQRLNSSQLQLAKLEQKVGSYMCFINLIDNFSILFDYFYLPQFRF